MTTLAWPDAPRSEWDDLDLLTAETIHEGECQRWPHRLKRRLEVPRSSWWNLATHKAAAWLCDPLVQPAPSGVEVEEA